MVGTGLVLGSTIIMLREWYRVVRSSCLGLVLGCTIIMHGMVFGSTIIISGLVFGSTIITARFGTWQYYQHAEGWYTLQSGLVE
jgi:hypothetical protein